MRILLHPQEQPSGSGRAIDKGHLQALETNQVVAVNMTEEACCWWRFVWMRSEMIYPDVRELLDIAVERRHVDSRDDAVQHHREISGLEQSTLKSACTLDASRLLCCGELGQGFQHEGGHPKRVLVIEERLMIGAWVKHCRLSSMGSRHGGQVWHEQCRDF